MGECSPIDGGASASFASRGDQRAWHGGGASLEVEAQFDALAQQYKWDPEFRRFVTDPQGFGATSLEDFIQAASDDERLVAIVEAANLARRLLQVSRCRQALAGLRKAEQEREDRRQRAVHRAKEEWELLQKRMESEKVPLAFFKKLPNGGLRTLLLELLKIYSDKFMSYWEFEEGPLGSRNATAPLILVLSPHQQLSLACRVGRGLLIPSEPPLVADFLSISFLRYLLHDYLPQWYEMECMEADPGTSERSSPEPKSPKTKAEHQAPEKDREQEFVQKGCERIAQERKFVKEDRRRRGAAGRNLHELRREVEMQYDSKLPENVLKSTLRLAQEYHKLTTEPNVEDGLRHTCFAVDGTVDEVSSDIRQLIADAVKDIRGMGKCIKLDPHRHWQWQRWETAVEMISGQLLSFDQSGQGDINAFRKNEKFAFMLSGPITQGGKAWDLLLATAEKETQKFEASWTPLASLRDQITLKWVFSLVGCSFDVEPTSGYMFLSDECIEVIERACKDDVALQQLRENDDGFINDLLKRCREGGAPMHFKVRFPSHRGHIAHELSAERQMLLVELHDQKMARWVDMWHENINGNYDSIDERFQALKNIPSDMLNLDYWHAQDDDTAWHKMSPTAFVQFRDFDACARRCLSCKAREVLGGIKMKVCTDCRVATYCSSDCQRKHWPEHKAVCLRSRKEARSKTPK